MSADFFRAVRSARAIKVNDVERTKGVRLYRSFNGNEAYQSEWTLQVRGPSQLANHREGKDFIVAAAGLDREDLLALRDAINAELEKK